MCGRFGVETEYVQLALWYQAAVGVEDPGPRFNIAPSQPVAVVFDREGKRVLDEFRWGLVPRWAKDPAIGNRLINARAETVASLPSFRDAFKERRCVIPATRYYEWQRAGSRKIPHSIARPDGASMSFAGLWEAWRDRATGELLYTCVIITTEANATLARIHDRMPVILPRDAIDAWLAPNEDPITLQRLLQPRPDDELHAEPIGTLINDPRHNGPEVLEPASEDPDRPPTQPPLLG
jgi:putative SOS response-associated peptidase YedK